MFLKLNKHLASLFLIIFLVIPQGSYIGAQEECELIEVDKSKPFIRKTLPSQYLKNQLSAIPKQYSQRKRMGILGEVTARDVIEAKNWNGKRYVSIITMFDNMNCEVTPYLRDNADRGIDDIFVVVRKDGWIDQRYHPIFHESKYDGGCNLKLKNTLTLCSQLSFQWLNRNLEKAYERTTRANLCFGNTKFLITSCTTCKTAFQENIIWLKNRLENRIFNRTASLLCPNGQLSIYKVNGS